MSELKPCPAGHEAILMAGGERVDCSVCSMSATSVAHWNRRAPDREALVEVARRAANAAKSYGSVEWSDAEAERIVAEYLGEKEKT